MLKDRKTSVSLVFGANRSKNYIERQRYLIISIISMVLLGVSIAYGTGVSEVCAATGLHTLHWDASSTPRIWGKTKQFSNGAELAIFILLL